MGENTCKFYIWWRVNIKNKEPIQLKSNKQTNKQTKITYNYKMGRGTEQPFFQRRHTNGQQKHEKVLNSTDHQENAIKMHNELSPHTC